MTVQRILEVLEEKFGDLDNNQGCYVSVGTSRKWMSIKTIAELIKSVDNEE